MKKPRQYGAPDVPVPEFLYDQQGQAHNVQELLSRARSGPRQLVNLRSVTGVMQLTPDEIRRFSKMHIKELVQIWPSKTKTQLYTFRTRCRYQAAKLDSG